ncbi:hypothetical protein ACUNV4_25165 [Granulosicoccus sp. 3-233]|uniref:hypothetical protein n=1 Tax=Granulosicoccus sp. 3-233 TaxID=3417969 RepID=UPI003D33F498
MSMSLQVATISGLCALVVTAWLWLSPDTARRSLESAPADKEVAPAADTGSAGLSASPFALSTQSSTLIDGEAAEQASKPDDARERDVESVLPGAGITLDVSRLAGTVIGDEDFDATVALLRADPALLQRLIDEFRQEQDPDRRHRLMKLLGHAGGADVTLLASELVYSGDDASRELGLQMLQRAQPGSAEVQQIASELLATEIEPRVLVNTLATLARPGTVNTENQALLADQVAVMASHPDDGVRGISLDILSRLSTDGRDTPVLLAGLTDASERVREAAAYALVGHEEDSVAVRSSLWQMLRDSGQGFSPRSAAILALRSLTLSEEEQGELELIERQLYNSKRQQSAAGARAVTQ